jgi:glyoxylase I family protein
MFKIEKLLHASVLVADTEIALEFYRDVLGMEVNPQRPDMKFNGAWLQIGDAQIHLLELPNPDPREGRPAHGGRDRHVALQVNSVAELRKRLDENAIDYTMSQSGRAAVFCRDPDGNALEFSEPS